MVNGEIQSISRTETLKKPAPAIFLFDQNVQNKEPSHNHTAKLKALTKALKFYKSKNYNFQLL